MTSRILVGHVLGRLADLPDNSVHCAITSPPYYGLRNYNTEPQVWGGDGSCDHAWQTDRYYVEGGGGAGSSAEAFSEPGEANAARIKQARWRQDDTCTVCGAWRGHLGLEPTLDLYIEHLVQVFRDVRRVLRDDGVLFLNMGDSYAGSGKGGNPDEGKQATNRGSQTVGVLYGKVGESARQAAVTNVTRSPAGFKPKDLMMVPFRVALALQANGWYLRSVMPWTKRAAMPESVTDRPATAIEYVFMLSKSNRYFWDATAVRRGNSSPAQLVHNLRYAKRYDAYDSRAEATGQPGNVNNVGIHSRPGGIGRNFRNTDLFFDSLGLLLDEAGDPLALDVNPRSFKGAHFATFPTTLVEPLIQGGTSERGCCGACGAPWWRVMEQGGADMEARYLRGEPARHGIDGAAASGASNVGKFSGTSQTVGWEPSCDCHGSFGHWEVVDTIEHEWFIERPRVYIQDRQPTEDEIRPCTVLDPFVGSGTTLLVADRLGRDGWGIELLSDYGKMAAERVRNDAPMFTQVSLE